MKKLIVASLITLTLVACSSTVSPTTSAVTSTPTPSATLTLTWTPSSLPPTNTPEVQPTSAWNGIPLMPGAIASDGDEEGYVFTTHAAPEQVQEYYQLELAKLGWQALSQEVSNSSIVLSFVNSASATLTVSILSKGDEVLVILVK